MSGKKERVSEIAEKLRRNAGELVNELLDRNVNAIAEELVMASDGSGGFGLRIGLQLIGGKVVLEGKLSWSRKFADEEENVFEVADPENPTLPGIPEIPNLKHIKVRTGGGEMTFTNAKEAATAMVDAMKGDLKKQRAKDGEKLESDS